MTSSCCTANTLCPRRNLFISSCIAPVSSIGIEKTRICIVLSFFKNKNRGLTPYCCPPTHSIPRTSLAVAAPPRSLLIPFGSFRSSPLTELAQDGCLLLTVGYPEAVIIEAIVGVAEIAKRDPTVPRISVPTTATQNTMRATFNTFRVL